MVRSEIIGFVFYVSKEKKINNDNNNKYVTNYTLCIGTCWQTRPKYAVRMVCINNKMSNHSD